jgi:hypothetical protein
LKSFSVEFPIGGSTNGSRRAVYTFCGGICFSLYRQSAKNNGIYISAGLFSTASIAFLFPPFFWSGSFLDSAKAYSLAELSRS